MSTQGFSHFASNAPCRFALATPDGRHWSRGEFLEKLHKTAHALRQLSLQPEDRIVALLPNGADLLALHFAAASVGCQLEVFDSARGYEALARILADKATWAFFASEGYPDLAQDAVESATFPRSAAFAIGHIPGFNSFATLLEQQPATPLPNAVNPGTTSQLDWFQIPAEQHHVHYCALPLHDVQPCSG